MTKAELIAELEGLSRGWHESDTYWKSDDRSKAFDQAADDLDALIARAKQTTDTTP